MPIITPNDQTMRLEFKKGDLDYTLNPSRPGKLHANAP